MWILRFLPMRILCSGDGRALFSSYKDRDEFLIRVLWDFQLTTQLFIKKLKTSSLRCTRRGLGLTLHKGSALRVWLILLFIADSLTCMFLLLL